MKNPGIANTIVMTNAPRTSMARFTNRYRREFAGASANEVWPTNHNLSGACVPAANVAGKSSYTASA